MFMKQLQRVFKVLANPRRLAMVQLLLTRKELSVGTLAGAMKLSITATSKHLALLANADVLDKRQESLMVYYRISDQPLPHIRSILDLLRRGAEE